VKTTKPSASDLESRPFSELYFANSTKADQLIGEIVLTFFLAARNAYPVAWKEQPDKYLMQEDGRLCCLDQAAAQDCAQARGQREGSVTEVPAVGLREDQAKLPRRTLGSWQVCVSATPKPGRLPTRCIRPSKGTSTNYWTPSTVLEEAQEGLIKPNRRHQAASRKSRQRLPAPAQRSSLQCGPAELQGRRSTTRGRRLGRSVQDCAQRFAGSCGRSLTTSVEGRRASHRT
jgi:hypothetical protein